MGIESRVSQLERKSSAMNNEVVIVFQEGNHFLIHRDNGGIVNEVYGSKDEITFKYKDCLGVIVFLNGLGDIQQLIESEKDFAEVELLVTASEQQNYEHFINVIKEKAEMIKNIDNTETGAVTDDI